MLVYQAGKFQGKNMQLPAQRAAAPGVDQVPAGDATVALHQAMAESQGAAFFSARCLSSSLW